MTELGKVQTQVLRAIDKADNIGRDGVVNLLQKPIDEAGAGLDPVKAEMIGRFIDMKDDYSSEKVQRFIAHSRLCRDRLSTLAFLEDTVVDAEGTTAFDRLLNMPVSDDQTWGEGTRPENIAWALDDLAECMSQQGQGDER